MCEQFNNTGRTVRAELNEATTVLNLNPDLNLLYNSWAWLLCVWECIAAMITIRRELKTDSKIKKKLQLKNIMDEIEIQLQIWTKWYIYLIYNIYIDTYRKSLLIYSYGLEAKKEIWIGWENWTACTYIDLLPLRDVAHEAGQTQQAN